ncbi:Claudin-11 [Gossypium arboreum]|uniref:Claudin-11 n=1 Tax=Gossypium arboreum TaxID=29729 RepID=A0A0B0PAP5_GOSAR|nr:Claudin-11 [Gossypium arboreum]
MTLLDTPSNFDLNEVNRGQWPICKLSRTKKRGDVRRRPCEEPLVGAQLSGIFQKLLVLSTAKHLFGFRISARFRIWVYEFGLKLYLGWYKFFIWA